MMDAILSLSVFLLAGWAVMCPKVRDGVIIKIGLICISAGSLIRIESHDAHILVNAGILIVAIGVILRVKNRSNGRRLTDKL